VLAAVILSAGQSSRMGTPKALVDFRGKTFLARAFDAAQHPKIGLVRVVLGAGEAEIRRALSLPDEIVILNPDWERGQLSSIQSAIRALATDPSTASRPTDRALGAEPRAASPLHEGARDVAALDGILLCPVDHPLFTRALVAALVAAFYADAHPPIVVPTFRGRRGHPMIFARSLFPELLAAPHEQGARAVVWAHSAVVAEVPTDEEGVVLNLNDPEILQRAREAK
jgi:molybdenum cofactor cytidylyltransferase